MSKSASNPSLIHAIFLVSGTSIGAGMLAQPVVSSLMGFLPSTLMMVVSWAFMSATALILAEVCLWMQKDSHIISMSGYFLGVPGKVVAWAVYLFMAYLSLTAYISGGGDFLIKSFTINGLTVPGWASCLLFVLIFGIVIEVSSKAVSRLNTFLFVLLVVSYFLLVIIGFDGIQLDNLNKMDFSKSYMILPLLLASFSFQMIVPSLVGYLQQDRKKVRTAIIAGTGISFIIYALWNGIVLGHESSLGDAAMAKAYADGRPPTQVLSGGEATWFAFLVKSFSFFALVTSFIGISWGTFDFLADGIGLQKKGKNRLLLWMMVVIPPLILAASYPEGFISALESTGAYGDTILNALIPILMFWIGHHIQKRHSGSRFLGSRVVLVGLGAFALAIILYQIYLQLCL